MKYILILILTMVVLSACKKEKSPHPSYLTIDDKSYTLTDIYWVEGGRSPLANLRARDTPGFYLGLNIGTFPNQIFIYIIIF